MKPAQGNYVRALLTSSTEYSGTTTDTIHCIDVREGLTRRSDESVDCVVMSRPYWRTRDYGVAQSNWPDSSICALGLEPNFNLYVQHLCVIFDGIERILEPTRM